MKTFHVNGRHGRLTLIELNNGRVKRLSGTIGGPKTDKTQDLCWEEIDLGRGKEHRVPLVDMGQDEEGSDIILENNNPISLEQPAPMVFASIDEVVAHITRADGSVEKFELDLENPEK